MRKSFAQKTKLVNQLLERYKKMANVFNHNLYGRQGPRPSDEAINSAFQFDDDRIKTLLSEVLFEQFFMMNGIDLLGFYREIFMQFPQEEVKKYRSQMMGYLWTQGLMHYMMTELAAFLQQSIFQDGSAQVAQKAEIANNAIQQYLLSDTKNMDEASDAVDDYCEFISNKYKEYDRLLEKQEIIKPNDAFYLQKFKLFFNTAQGIILRYYTLIPFYQALDSQLPSNSSLLSARGLLPRYQVALLLLDIQQRNFRTFLETSGLSKVDIECEYQTYFLNASSKMEKAFDSIQKLIGNAAHFSQAHYNDAVIALESWECFLKKEISSLFSRDNELSENESEDDVVVYRGEIDTPQVVPMTATIEDEMSKFNLDGGNFDEDNCAAEADTPQVASMTAPIEIEDDMPAFNLDARNANEGEDAKNNYAAFFSSRIHGAQISSESSPIASL